MKRHNTFLSAALALTALPLFLSCNDSVTGPEAPPRVPGGPSAQVTLTVSPASAAVEVNETIQFTATLRGAVLNAHQVKWFSSDPDRARVSGDGLVQGIAPGSVVITAEYQAASGRAFLLVNGTGGGQDDDKHLPDGDKEDSYEKRK